MYVIRLFGYPQIDNINDPKVSILRSMVANCNYNPFISGVISQTLLATLLAVGLVGGGGGGRDRVGYIAPVFSACVLFVPSEWNN